MISFIMPTYNSGKTIENAIKSILEQEETGLEYEIIIVDDESHDNTDKIMEKYKNNKNIKYYVRDNSGVADSRNYGVKKAIGEYIIFVDSDDYISKTLLKDIEDYLKQDIELIKWNPIFVDEKGVELKRFKTVSFNTVTGEEGFNLLFGKDNLIDCLWNYAIKKEIMIEFPKGRYHEDFAVMPRIILQAKSFIALNKYEYYYVQSKNSIMRNSDMEKTKKKLQDKLHNFDILIEETDKMKIGNLAKENAKIYYTNSMLAVLPELSKENKKYYKKELRKRKISKYIKARNLKQLIKKVLYKCVYF